MATTLADYRTRVREKADEESTGFITDAKLVASINRAAGWVWRKIASKSGSRYVTRGTVANGGVFNTVAGQEAYDWPAAARKLVSIQRRASTSTNDAEYLPVGKVSLTQGAGSTGYSPRRGCAPEFGYFIADREICLRPVPSAVFTLRLWFGRSFTKMTADASVSGIEEEYDDLIIDLAALDVLGQTGEPLFEERFKLFQLELGMADESSEPRDHQPESMVMTEEMDEPEEDLGI